MLKASLTRCSTVHLLRELVMKTEMNQCHRIRSTLSLFVFYSDGNGLPFGQKCQAVFSRVPSHLMKTKHPKSIKSLRYTSSPPLKN
jgi:hypothetical protein